LKPNILEKNGSVHYTVFSLPAPLIPFLDGAKPVFNKNPVFAPSVSVFLLFQQKNQFLFQNISALLF
jgi:hypothetical protein